MASVMGVGAALFGIVLVTSELAHALIWSLCSAFGF